MWGKNLATRFRETGRPMLRSLAVLVCLLAAMTFFGRVFLLYRLDDSIIIMLYFLTVFLISRFTVGYWYGVAASLLSVFLFNFFFTEPYFSIDVYDPKYPFVFGVMLVISLVTSALTVRISRSADERIQLVRSQEKTRQDLESEKLRGTILRSISHDLRSPLTSISGSASLLLDNSAQMDADQQKQLLENIYQESIWLGRFVENLLSLTRIDDQLLRLDTRPEMLEEVIAETVVHARRRCGTCSIVTHIPDEPILADMDFALIEQVLSNLLDNAVSHTPQGGVIEIDARKADGHVVIGVRDHGEGIPAAYLDRVFDRYFVGSEPRVDNRRGFGLGLTICRSIVQAHHGTLVAFNHPDGGAVFEFSLPLSEDVTHDT